MHSEQHKSPVQHLRADGADPGRPHPLHLGARSLQQQRGKLRVVAVTLRQARLGGDKCGSSVGILCQGHTMRGEKNTHETISIHCSIQQ